LILLALTI